MNNNTAQNNKRIAKNTLFLYFRMLLMMFVTLYTSRVVIQELGIDDFGTYSIVAGIVVFFSFLNSAVTSATQRFLSFELGKKDYFRFQKILNISLLIYVFLAIIIIILCETFGLWFLNTQMTIDVEKMRAANVVFHFSILTFIFGLLRTPYNAAIIAHERMSFYAFISIIEVFLKLIVVYLLRYLPFPKLETYGCLLAIVMLVVSLSYMAYCILLFKECRFKWIWDRDIARKLLSFSGWSMFGSFAVITANQGVNIVMNLFYGVSINAAMGISHQVANAVNQFVTNFQTAFNPQITKNYAVGDNIYLINLIEKTAKFSFLLMSVLVVPLLLGMNEVLELWLGTVPPYTAVLCQLTLIAYLIDAFSAPLYMTVQATGRIRTYQFCVSLLFFMNIVLSYILFSLGYSPISSMYVKIVVSVILLIYRINYLRKEIQLPVWQFIINSMLKSVIIFIISIYGCSIWYEESTSVFLLFLQLISCAILTLILIGGFGLTKNERTVILKMIRR